MAGSGAERETGGEKGHSAKYRGVGAHFMERERGREDNALGSQEKHSSKTTDKEQTIAKFCKQLS